MHKHRQTHTHKNKMVWLYETTLIIALIWKWYYQGCFLLYIKSCTARCLKDMDPIVHGDICLFLYQWDSTARLRMQVPFSSVQHLCSLKGVWVNVNVKANNRLNATIKVYQFACTRFICMWVSQRRPRSVWTLCGCVCQLWWLDARTLGRWSSGS